MKIIATLLLLISVNLPPRQPNCRCKKASDAESIHWGNDPVQYSGDVAVKSVRGKVMLPDGEALGDALVAVFDKPAEEIYVYRLDSGKRLAACKTGKDGSFCFAGLRPKKYVVCASSSRVELKAVCRSVKLVPAGRRGSKRGLSFMLELSI